MIAVVSHGLDLSSPRCIGDPPVCAQFHGRGLHKQQVRVGGFRRFAHKMLMYSWGRGEDGQLGLGDTADLQKPTQVAHLKDIDVSQVGS